MRQEISRRRALGVLGGGVVLGSTGALLPGTPAMAHGEIESFPGVGGEPTVYEVSGNLSSFGYRPSFHQRMGDWLQFWFDNTPAFFRRPARIWTFGVHTDSRPSEAHNAGRGFDLTRIYATGNDGDRHRRFFGRFDLWRDNPPAELADIRRHYWATAASLHHHFRNVLTYAYDADHHNHIHIDNLVSEMGPSHFDTGSRAQVVNVQACCRFIWGKNTDVDGVWGPQTNQHSHEVLVRIGEGGFLTGPQEKWLRFNRASCRQGYGL
jgi:hypothetical protein